MYEVGGNPVREFTHSKRGITGMIQSRSANSARLVKSFANSVIQIATSRCEFARSIRGFSGTIHEFRSLSQTAKRHVDPISEFQFAQASLIACVNSRIGFQSH